MSTFKLRDGDWNYFGFECNFDITRIYQKFPKFLEFPKFFEFVQSHGRKPFMRLLLYPTNSHHYQNLLEYIQKYAHLSGFVYVIRERCTGLVKIGYSRDPIKRFQSLQGELKFLLRALWSFWGHGRPSLELLTVIPATPQVEDFLLALLSENRFGEWIIPSPFVDCVIALLELLRISNGYLAIVPIKDALPLIEYLQLKKSGLNNDTIKRMHASISPVDSVVSQMRVQKRVPKGDL
jgi:hypothetical protein